MNVGIHATYDKTTPSKYIVCLFVLETAAPIMTGRSLADSRCYMQYLDYFL